MSLETLESTPPPFFKQGISALSKLVFFGALSLVLMLADSRLQLTYPIRAAVATVLYPVQWLAMQPKRLAQSIGLHVSSVRAAQQTEAQAEQKLALQTLRASQVEQLVLENNRLRKLLELREHLAVRAQAAEVLYDAADPYTHKVIIDQGSVQHIALGSPVVDEAGVLGQVTRVLPLTSEVTLLIDRDHAVPVLNTRTGARSVAYGDPVTRGGSLELRFMPSNADVQVGDLLTTSGVDGVYPPGLPIARIAQIERRSDSAFARIYCTPQALAWGVQHVMVLQPQAQSLPLPPPQTPSSAPSSAPRAKDKP
jgi:rod shape-determining protein MreC